MQMNGDYSIYFHIPFCTRKCDYCHFYVIPDKDPFKVLYMTALKKEWDLRAPLIPKRAPISIYFGGGTPALLGPSNIEKILSWISPPLDVEITLEANPENMTLDLFQAYKKIGINRLSLGVQSLDDSELLSLSRNHTAATAERSVRLAKDVGFENISIDLMYDIPSQSQSTWENTLSKAIQLPISHLSLYNLTIEPQTVFYKKRKMIADQMPDSEASLLLLTTAVQILQSAGLIRYEISAFSHPNVYSRHNYGYWTKRPFLGFGPSAFSFWGGSRFRNIANLHRYSKFLEKGEDPIDFRETLPPLDALRESLAVGLRLIEGMQRQEWPPEIESVLFQLEREGFIALDTHLRLTEKGLLFHDTVAEKIFESSGG